MGVPKQEILEASPKDLWCYDDAHKLRLKKQDEDAWLQGKYFAEAIMSTIGNAFKEKGSQNCEYPKKPYSFEEIDINNSNNNSKEEVAVYEMKQRIKILEKSGLPMSPD